MQELDDFRTPHRPRFRSVKYNISHCKTSTKIQPLKNDISRSRNRSIINVNKLNSISNIKKASLHQNYTMDATESKDTYLKTFLSFASKDFYLQNTQEKQNIDTCALITHYDHEFDQKTSNFTFLDPMKKPTQYIQKLLHASNSELKGQQYDVVMLKAELNRIKIITERNIDQLSKNVKQKLSIITKAFRGSEVAQQQTKLRHRKDVSLLIKGYNLNRSLVDSLNQRNLTVQDKIFACRPFEMQIRQIVALQLSDEQE